MPSAKIINFPRAARRPIPSPVRYAVRPHSRPNAGGFSLLLFVTLPAAFLYLSGAAHVARYDALYTVLLAVAWGLYFLHPPLLKVPVFGPLLIRIGRLLLFASLSGFFGGIYWLIFSSHG
ncbi:MAG TPA: hypothetical protein VN688_00200 [Gemmataceae bacterium]|nr:hypothetical protein [Gemmataceae bacterium]